MKRTRAFLQASEDCVFGQRLREIRLKRGLTLTALSDLVGIKHQQLSQIELGVTLPLWPTVLRLADALEVTADEFR